MRTEVTRTARGPEGVDVVDCREQLGAARRKTSGELFQLEMVGRHHLCDRDRAIAQKFGNAGPHEHALRPIADDGIAAIGGHGVRGLRLADGGKDRLAGCDRTEIAGQNAVAGCERAARGNAIHHARDMVGCKHLASPGAVAGVVRELHGVNRPDFATKPLKGEHRGGIADMAISDMRLDREQVHGQQYRTARVSRANAGGTPALR